MFKQTKLLALASFGMFIGCGVLHANDANIATNQTNKSVQASTETPKSDQIDMQKLSEAFGHFIGRNLQAPGLQFDLEAIIKGIREGAAGKPAPLSEKEYEEMMAAVQERAFKEMSTKNLKNANDFMIKNSQSTDVTEIVPGKLQYSVEKEGTGPVVEPHSSPKIHYTGKYQDGTVFGTSEEMDGPITIPLDQTIPGFSKGIVGMKEGEKRRLYVHPDLGYGTTGQLPPNELLIFDIEVIKANSDDAKTKTGKSADDADEEDLFIDEEEYDLEPAQKNAKTPEASNTSAKN
ncbi:FKBP-type peptidyl-prolyl cis-trans isomerase [Candidatus Protochlamydia sp. R18]|uniref:FKBP-type peptidyl-prolyl cis-trans isomerase n=1 Tax=Candidatus Protochlamydia sp. R18 TaxID=1353977 RepID=UPI0005AB40BA|nr:FKBP-type peptidyl-prolyl cis-trans isomerase [Candidatus Protochlamydia sp. R18]